MKKFIMPVLFLSVLISTIFFYNKEKIKISTLKNEENIELKSNKLGDIKLLEFYNIGDVPYVIVGSYKDSKFNFTLLDLINLKSEKVFESKIAKNQLGYKFKPNITEDSFIIPRDEFIYEVKFNRDFHKNKEDNKLSISNSQAYNIKSEGLDYCMVGGKVAYKKQGQDSFLYLLSRVYEEDKEQKLYFTPEEITAVSHNNLFFVSKEQGGSRLRVSDLNGKVQKDGVANVVTTGYIRNSNEVTGIKKNEDNYELFSLGKKVKLLTQIENNVDIFNDPPRACGYSERDNSTIIYYTEFDENGLGTIKSYDEVSKTTKTVVNKKKILAKIACIKNFNSYILYYELEGDKIIPKVYDETHNNTIDISKHIGL